MLIINLYFLIVNLNLRLTYQNTGEAGFRELHLLAGALPIELGRKDIRDSLSQQSVHLVLQLDISVHQRR